MGRPPGADTFLATFPFTPSVISNSTFISKNKQACTFSPSLRNLKPLDLIAVWWTNTIYNNTISFLTIGGEVGIGIRDDKAVTN